MTPITAEELAAACEVVRAAVGGDLRFPVVALADAERGTAERGTAERGTAARRVEVQALDRASGDLHEAVVDLSQRAVVASRTLRGVMPALLFDESLNAILAVQADKRWLAAMAERGITDIERVQIDPWPAGNFDLPGEEGRRLARCVCYLRDDPADNGYAHPVEGLVAVVDLATDEVIDVVDSGVVPVPTGSGRYGEGPYRDGLKPIEITQPEGPSFRLEDNEVSWLGWRLGFSVHPIEGLVLHGISYQGRPVLARASIAEMVVPYGASGVCHWWKNAFDVGEWGLGRMIQSLALGCDCLGEIRYADAVLPDEMGGARVVANAVCMHEEDYGILWKHVDLWTGNDQVRRSRRFVISSVSTVGNYEYGFYWYFYLDGTIQLEVKLTGIMQTAAGPPEPGRGTRLAEGLWAPNHQHLFCARLDVCVDGPSNSVSEVEAGGAPRGPGNEAGNAIVTRSTPLDTEAGAQRLADPMVSRRWRIENRAAGTAYDLVPMSPVTLLADATSSVARRAQFATRNLWVTPYTPDERRPAGDHPNQHPGGDGLPAWTAADRPIVDRELVVWHTFGVNHLPRPEDWPVMPVEYAGFMLRPFGFFERNPALDLPPSHSEHCAG